MNADRREIPPDAVEDVAYISRSPNRIRILDALANGPHSRRQLEAFTDASRTTLDRIVNELEARGWAERTVNGDYEATSVGRALVDQFVPFIDAIVAIRRLDEAVAWIPTDDVSIELQHFRDASVRWPERDDPMATIDHFTDLIQDTTEFRVLTDLAAPTPLAEAMRDRIDAERLTGEYVIAGEIVEYMRARPDRRARWREMIDGGASVFRHEGTVPCNMYIFDDTVMIKKGGVEPIEEGYGAPIKSENGAVLAWAHGLIDRYRDAATRLDVESFTESSTAPETESGTR